MKPLALLVGHTHTHTHTHTHISLQGLTKHLRMKLYIITIVNKISI